MKSNKMERTGRTSPTVMAGAVLVSILTLAIAGFAATEATAPQPSASAVGTAASVASATNSWNFDSDRAYQPPAGWTIVSGPWFVVQNPTAPSQPNVYGLKWVHFWTSLARMVGFNSISVVNDPTDYSDFTLDGNFNPLGGAFSSSGGLIFRYQDAKNYYVLAAELPAQELVLYKVSNGEFTTIKKAPATFTRERWYALKVEAKGGHFACSLDERPMFEADDSTFAAGRYGLWARSDSTAQFDNLVLTPAATAAR